MVIVFVVACRITSEAEWYGGSLLDRILLFDETQLFYANCVSKRRSILSVNWGSVRWGVGVEGTGQPAIQRVSFEFN